MERLFGYNSPCHSKRNMSLTGYAKLEENFLRNPSLGADFLEESETQTLVGGCLLLFFFFKSWTISRRSGYWSRRWCLKQEKTTGLFLVPEVTSSVIETINIRLPAASGEGLPDETRACYGMAPGQDSKPGAPYVELAQRSSG